MIEPHFENILDKIIANITRAKHEILICMAWFTDKEIMNALLEKVNEGLFVDLILFDTKNNKTNQAIFQGIQQLTNFKIALRNFESVGGNITLINETYDFYLHSKFCIIDKVTVITGSYNWTYPARTHIENILIVNDKNVAKKYIEEFNKIKEKKLNLVLDRNFPKCNQPNCYGNIIKMRLYNYNNTSNEFTEEYVDFEICDTDLSHITNISANSSWNLYLSDIYDFEHERLQFMQQTEDVNSKTLKRNIDEQLASLVNSRIDLFSKQIQNDILIIGSVISVLDGWDNEETVISILWNHEVTNELVKYLEDFSVEIIDKVNGF